MEAEIATCLTIIHSIGPVSAQEQVHHVALSATLAEGAALADGASDAPFNGLRPDERVVCELINDGVHVAAEVVRIVFSAAPGRVAMAWHARCRIQVRPCWGASQ